MRKLNQPLLADFEIVGCVEIDMRMSRKHGSYARGAPTKGRKGS